METHTMLYRALNTAASPALQTQFCFFNLKFKPYKQVSKISGLGGQEVLI